MGTLDGKVVIVTGAARGLGRDYARFFARDGAAVVVADIADTTAAAADVRAAGAECLALSVDVADRGRAEAMAERTVEVLGSIDILVNNAGVWRGLGDVGLLDCPDDVWNRAWAVNVTGTLRCCQAVLPVMLAQRSGRVVNISSMASSTGSSPYGLTKATVERLTAGLAREVGDCGVTVNCIAPGLTAFERATGQIPIADAVIADNVVKRMGTSHELYEAIGYLCSDAAAYVTGQTLRIDGGALAR